MVIGVASFEARLDGMVDEIGALVRCESPSADQAACARSADLVAQLGTAHLRTTPEVLVVDGATHLRWVLGDPDAPRRVLLLGHHDTVWPVGTVERLPWDVAESADGPVLRGPGCFDMKAGLVQLWYALGALIADGHAPAATVLVTGDEEIGSPSARSLIEDAARSACAALVSEPSADGGALKSARKGVSLYSVQVTGRAAHAGLEPERGINAGVELAAQALRVARLGDEAAGTTVTPTALSAGTTSNTVPAAGRLSVDVRAWTADEQHRVDEQLRAAEPTLDGARIDVHGGINRPPLDAGSSVALLALARDLHERLGLGSLSDRPVGGGSDGNFAAGVGTPTLDGLGAVGGGAHADNEHVLAAYLPGRTALLAALVEELTR